VVVLGIVKDDVLNMRNGHCIFYLDQINDSPMPVTLFWCRASICIRFATHCSLFLFVKYATGCSWMMLACTMKARESMQFLNDVKSKH
jgi:hypothetical protein